MATLPLHLGRLVSWIIRQREMIAWGIMLFPLLFITLMITGKLITPSFYRTLVAENNVVELATLLVYLLASAAAASLVVDLWRQSHPIYALMYSVLSAGLFVIAMEEISWGQHLIKNPSPEFFERYNRQGETNLHNIDVFPLHLSFIVVGLYGAFSRMILPAKLKKDNTKLVELLTPPYYLFLYFFITAALYIYYEYLYFTQLRPLGLEWEEFFTEAAFIAGKDQEPIELLLGLAFLLFVVVNKVRYRRGGPAARLALRRAI
jgi:hypothetical protein